MGDRIRFSYASADDPALRRIAIRAIERLTGQPRLQRIYLENQRDPGVGETFWEAAVRRLELRIEYDAARLRAIPAAGPVVIVANHPFGVLDGIVVGHLVAKVRTDFKILTNSVLCRARELEPYLLPIDFARTPAALVTNLRSRADVEWAPRAGQVGQNLAINFNLLETPARSAPAPALTDKPRCPRYLSQGDIGRDAHPV